MSESEKRKILESIDEALPEMSEFDKGYLLGMAESRAAEKKTDVKISLAAPPGD